MNKLVSSWILLTSTLALALSFVVFSHAADKPAIAPTDANSGQRPALRGGHGLGPFAIFDTNHDGVISADEIANASAVLRKLDTNGDGKLTVDELRQVLRPPHPPRDQSDQNGPQGPDGDMPPPPPPAE